jgi:hypothetical protein
VRHSISLGEESRYLLVSGFDRDHDLTEGLPGFSPNRRNPAEVDPNPVVK